MFAVTETYLLWLAPLGVALCAFALIWPLSVVREDASLVDLAWGPGFLLQLVVVALLVQGMTERGWLLLCLVGVWSLRLGLTLGLRRWREGHEDPRYTAVRKSWGPSFWWKSFFIVFVLQAVLQWLISLGPIAGLLADASPPGWIAVVGAIVAMSGLALETAADHQLDRFKKSAPEGALMQTGLRAHMRHPNYTGEIVFWTGIALVCVEGGAWLGLLSPVLITFFLTKVSGAPMLDEHLMQTRPAYEEYRARVPAFFPRLGGGLPQ